MTQPFTRFLQALGKTVTAVASSPPRACPVCYATCSCHAMHPCMRLLLIARCRARAWVFGMTD